MSFIYTIQYAAPERADGVPWTQVRHEEAQLSDGPWTALATVALNPLDPNPSLPAVREFTVAASIAAGWLRAVWLDAAGNQDVGAPTLIGPDWLPTVIDVARVIRARVRDELGNLIPNFTASTSPSATEVEDYVADAADYLIGRLGVELPAEQLRAARHVCALRSAMLVLSGSQRRRSADAYKDVAALYEEELRALIAALPSDVAAPRRGSIATPTIYTAATSTTA